MNSAASTTTPSEHHRRFQFRCYRDGTEIRGVLSATSRYEVIDGGPLPVLVLVLDWGRGGDWSPGRGSLRIDRANSHGLAISTTWVEYERAIILPLDLDALGNGPSRTRVVLWNVVYT
jgi:hypothetical protein